jgi:phosphatidylglycerol:prolipoprotein diacylglycerol transferase
MDPIFVQIGPLAVRWYGLLIALGVLVGASWALKAAERKGLSGDKLLDMSLWLVVAGIVGARLVYVLTSPSAYFGPGRDWLDAFKVWEGGISIHGGVLGVLVAAWLYCRRHKLNLWSYMDIMTPVGALGIMGGRIGNIMNGTDTGGRLTDWAIGFHWPEPGTPTFGALGRLVFGDDLWQFSPPACAAVPFGEPCVVHFTQFYGFLVGFILVFVVAWGLRRNLPAGNVFWHFVLWYSVLRSVIEEPFRDNPLPWQVYLNDQAGVGIFTYTQLASIPIILIALYMLLTSPEREQARRPAEAR